MHFRGKIKKNRPLYINGVVHRPKGSHIILRGFHLFIYFNEACTSIEEKTSIFFADGALELFNRAKARKPPQPIFA